MALNFSGNEVTVEPLDWLAFVEDDGVLPEETRGRDGVRIRKEAREQRVNGPPFDERFDVILWVVLHISSGLGFTFADSSLSTAERTSSTSQSIPLPSSPLSPNSFPFKSNLPRPLPSPPLLAFPELTRAHHSSWIYSTVSHFLRFPHSGLTPTFHLFVPLRPTHTAEIESIEATFPRASDLPPRRSEGMAEGEGGGWRLAVVEEEKLVRTEGIGRADETCYRKYTIGWC